MFGSQRSAKGLEPVNFRGKTLSASVVQVPRSVGAEVNDSAQRLSRGIPTPFLEMKRHNLTRRLATAVFMIGNVVTLDVVKEGRSHEKTAELHACKTREARQRPATHRTGPEMQQRFSLLRPKL